MRNKKLSVSVGIPAYNEEANIRNLLLSILSQKEEGFYLKEIIIVSDGSYDETCGEVENMKDKRIILIKNIKRIGQALSQNKIIKKFTGDILILLNADIKLTNDLFICELIKPFYKFCNSNIGIVCPDIMVNKPKTFFQKVINYGFYFRRYLFKRWNNGGNLYLCSGRARAFSKKFAKKIKWPKVFSEDVYSFFLCKKNKYNFIFHPLTKILITSPISLWDHLKQSLRFKAGPKEMIKYFPKNFVCQNYNIPKIILLKGIILHLCKNPILFISYLFIFVITRFAFIDKKSINSICNPIWLISKSTKYLMDPHFQKKVKL